MIRSSISESPNIPTQKKPRKSQPQPQPQFRDPDQNLNRTRSPLSLPLRSNSIHQAQQYEQNLTSRNEQESPSHKTNPQSPLTSQLQPQLPKQKQKQKQLPSVLQTVKDVNTYSPEQLEIHRKIIEDMWDYRYWRLVENAVRTKNWMTVYSFIGEFKLKCVDLAKKLVSEKFSIKEIDRIDHRYEMKGQGQLGIYMLDGIIIRAAKVRKAKKQFDKRAQKNLHQQFISYNIVNNLVISLLTDMPQFPVMRVPVTCLIKYLGYTFLCQGDSMCNGIETLVYGPMSSTFKLQDNATEILNVIGRNLNLKSFKVLTAGNKLVQIPFCLTIQLHEVNIAFRDMSITNWFSQDSPFYPHHQKENRLHRPQYYLLNFSKLWPLFIDSNIVKSYGYLRPEAALAWKKQLSNAVFTNIAFQKDQQGQLQLAQACKNIKEQNIKQLANFLDEATFFVVDSVGIEDIMHHFRINMKFLGLVANKFTLVSNRRVFEVEMAARVLKKIFYTNCEGMDSSKYNIKDLIVDFLNLVFIQSSQGQKFYLDVVYPHIQKYYDYQLSEYPPPFTGGGLLHALSYHLGVRVKIIDYPFFKQIQSIFTVSHIIDIVAMARSFDLDTCALKKCCQKIKVKKKEGYTMECIAELNILATIAKLSCPEGTFSVGSAPEAYFYSELAEVYRYIKDEEQTYKYAELALKKIPEKHADAIKSYCTLIQYHSWKKQINRCLQYYEKSLANLSYHLQNNHPLSITVYNTLGYEFLSSSDPSKCQKIFAKSFQICEQALGYMHATSGKILLQLADLPLPPQKTINFLLQALTILQNIESDKQKVRNVCMKISEMYAKIGNLTKMIQFARKSDHWRMEIIALQKLNEYKMVLQLCSRPATNISQLKFLIQKSFSSYIKLLDFTSSNNLYKVFISLIDHLPNHQIASERIFRKLTTQLSISLTIVEFVKTSLNNLMMEIPDLLKESDFFVGSDFLLEYKDRRLRNVILSYMDILAIVGSEKSEKIFIQFRKTF